MKYLAEERLADWLPLVGQATTAATEVIEAELSTVTAAADKVLLVKETVPWLLNLEPCSNRDPDRLGNLHVYSALLERRHRLLVRTLVVLLRREADQPDLTGTYEKGFVGEPPYLVFRYRVVRLWQLSPESLLAGGLGLVPLAPLGNVQEAELPRLISRMKDSITRLAPV